MTFTPTQPSKNIEDLTLESKGLDTKTWDDAEETWDEADYPWDAPQMILDKPSKNTASLTNDSKN